MNANGHTMSKYIVTWGTTNDVGFLGVVGAIVDRVALCGEKECRGYEARGWRLGNQLGSGWEQGFTALQMSSCD